MVLPISPLPFMHLLAFFGWVLSIGNRTLLSFLGFLSDSGPAPGPCRRGHGRAPTRQRPNIGNSIHRAGGIVLSQRNASVHKKTASGIWLRGDKRRTVDDPAIQEAAGLHETPNVISDSSVLATSPDFHSGVRRPRPSPLRGARVRALLILNS